MDVWPSPGGLDLAGDPRADRPGPAGPIEDPQRLVDEKDPVTLRPWAGVHGGWLLSQDGRVNEGIDQMRRSIAA